MSVFDDQFEDWMENDCQGNIEDYDGAGNLMYDRHTDPRIKRKRKNK